MYGVDTVKILAAAQKGDMIVSNEYGSGNQASFKIKVIKSIGGNGRKVTPLMKAFALQHISCSSTHDHKHNKRCGDDSNESEDFLSSFDAYTARLSSKLRLNQSVAHS